jgi:arsenate reductase (glutaredoxin)
MIVYGIKNCDTMKKAFTWLDEHHIKYTFHNYKIDGISKQKLKQWIKEIPLTSLINVKGTTYRNLSEEEKQLLTKASNAFDIVIQNTSLLKRPIVETEAHLIAGFDEQVWISLFIKHT